MSYWPSAILFLESSKHRVPQALSHQVVFLFISPTAVFYLSKVWWSSEFMVENSQSYFDFQVAIWTELSTKFVWHAALQQIWKAWRWYKHKTKVQRRSLGPKRFTKLSLHTIFPPLLPLFSLANAIGWFTIWWWFCDALKGLAMVQAAATERWP